MCRIPQNYKEDKKMKKFKYKKELISLIAILSLSGSLIACSAVVKSDGTSKNATNSTVRTESIVSTGETTVDASDLVSDRDLDPTYIEEDTIKIELQNNTAACSSSSVSVKDSIITISSEGTYIVSGTLTDGQIVIDAGKEDKIRLILNGCSITSSDSAAIYVVSADKVFVTLAEGSTNTLSNGGTFTSQNDDNIDGVIFSKDDITFNGEGNLTIDSPAANGIVCKDDLVITGGTYQIDCAKNAIEANDSIAITDGDITITGCNDGLHAENDDDDTSGYIVIQGGILNINAEDDGIHGTSLVTIDDGNITINAGEGIEGTYITINGGTINISASDDGINAAHKSDSYTPTVEINGGEITIVMGQGDTDGIDSNGNLIITGGTIDVTGQSPFDYDGTCEYSGGTLIVNGSQTNTVSNQFAGGPGGGTGGPGREMRPF